MALSTVLTSTTLSALLLALASNIVTSTAAPTPNVFTDILLPTPNVTGGPAGEIQCYALPYGAVGVISHLLTYWTFAWIAVGKVPLWPGNDLDTWAFDLFLSIASLCTCIPTATITIYRCRLSWHFVLISVWKLVTSVSMACIAIHRCILVRREPSRSSHRGPGAPFTRGQSTKTKSLEPLGWLVLFIAGTIVGMFGLCSLLWTSFRQDTTVRTLSYGFAAPVILLPICVGIYWYLHSATEDKTGGLKGLVLATANTFKGASVAFIAVFGFFSTLYADLVLGAIADNPLGLPSADFAPLYWVWFIAKRLPMLSF
ncbi:uncharacterized protein M421DRAFT_424121 [Didymella exigua CBS 183.55]|uniref:Uncharacterized protein n=1 Tax=Didymella exigua CBS 183.55 TaxID=1150837 RepID=A0A6A5RD13_9PLEO|nr:uncharacterized protein M421DRAFT_424121 [Didymella exigua CBS 183.55]KAF1925098.1 hypothetical protein M421DRAFT_424121 [Didymella exigua CBS 183.55]